MSSTKIAIISIPLSLKKKYSIVKSDDTDYSARLKAAGSMVYKTSTRVPLVQ